jgi:hypothetical protein
MWWYMVTYGKGSEGGNWWMECIASTRHATSEHGVSGISTAVMHTSAAGSRLNWCPRWFKWTRPFRQKTKSGFCTCAIIFQLASILYLSGCQYWIKVVLLLEGEFFTSYSVPAACSLSLECLTKQGKEETTITCLHVTGNCISQTQIVQQYLLVWRKERQYRYCRHIVRVIKYRRMGWAGRVARMGEERGHIGSWWGNWRESDHWGDLGVDGWIILG